MKKNTIIRKPIQVFIKTNESVKINTITKTLTSTLNSKRIPIYFNNKLIDTKPVNNTVEDHKPVPDHNTLPPPSGPLTKYSPQIFLII